MKFDIKSLLTGTTLFVASASSIDAVPPKGISLIDGVTVTHPIFGKMKVISHEEDIKYYDDHKGYDLVEDFMKYVLNVDSYDKEYGVDEDKVKCMLGDRIAVTKAGEAALKVITANYMREYDRIKQFCEKHKKDLEAYREESLKHTEYVKICRLVEKLKRFYSVEVSPYRTVLRNDVKEKEVSIDDLLKLYERFKSEELATMEVGDLLKEVLDLDDNWEVVKERCENWYRIEKDYPEALKEFFERRRDEFEEICDAYSSIKEWEKSDDIQKLIILGKVLEQAYEAETKAENERRFSLIRHESIPACDFLTLYEHFFEKKSEIEDINNILFHALTLKKGQGGYMRLASGEPVLCPGYEYSNENQGKNYYWIDIDGNLLTRNSGDEALDIDEKEYEECGSLHHELLHFMNDICWSTQEKTEAKDIFKKNDTLLQQLKDEFKEYGQNVMSVLKDVYDDSAEMWTMYGILYVPNAENEDEGEFYYDPINEAVSNGEYKILAKKERKRDGGEIVDLLVEKWKSLVRIGHYVDPRQVSCVKKLNAEKGIYSFYFGEKLRNLIPER